MPLHTAGRKKGQAGNNGVKLAA